MATLAVHDKKASDEAFEQFLPVISSERGIPELYQKGGYLGSPFDRKEEPKLDEKVETLYL
jgi:hypothetical protein